MNIKAIEQQQVDELHRRLGRLDAWESQASTRKLVLSACRFQSDTDRADVLGFMGDLVGSLNTERTDAEALVKQRGTEAFPEAHRDQLHKQKLLDTLWEFYKRGIQFDLDGTHFGLIPVSTFTKSSKMAQTLAILGRGGKRSSIRRTTTKSSSKGAVRRKDAPSLA